jgi:hypothetical protein
LSTIVSVKADLARVKELEATMPNPDLSGLSALQTAGEILAYSIVVARADGYDEADMVELVARAVDMPPAKARHHAQLLQRLGYTAAAARLKQIAGRRRLVPLS